MNTKNDSNIYNKEIHYKQDIFLDVNTKGTLNEEQQKEAKYRFEVLQEWNSMTYKERSLKRAFEFISDICSKNNIAKIIIDDAKNFYKKFIDCEHKIGTNISDQIIIRGKKRLSIVAACVFKACEKNNNPLSTKEMAEIFNLDEKNILDALDKFYKFDYNNLQKFSNI